MPIVKQMSFTKGKEEGHCEFEPVLSRTTNETLRLISTPPCKTTFHCKDQDKSTVNLIHCDLDGLFDRKAVCPSSKTVNNLIFLVFCLI